MMLARASHRLRDPISWSNASQLAKVDVIDDRLDELLARMSQELRDRSPGRMNAAEGFVPILNRLAQAIAETRSMRGPSGLPEFPPEEWDAGFREPWLDLLTRLGAAVLNADVDELREARADLTACADHLVPEESHDLWPVYGALLVNLRNIMDALSAVAEAQPVQAASPLAPRQPVG